jgi:hypothetical protein
LWKLLVSKLDSHSSKADVNSENPSTSGKDKVTKDFWKEVCSRDSEEESNRAKPGL